jgi:hypothetical protein
MVGRDELSLTDLLIEFLIRLALEREVSAEKSIEKNAACPDISWRP